jgi:aspartate aminotransferase
MKVSMLAGAIPQSETFAIDARVKEMVSRGLDVISFGLGEPDLDTPENVKNAMIDSIRKNRTKYTSSAGILELREAIRKKLLKENSLDYSINEITSCNGAKHALFNALFSIINPGDEVIIIRPFWISYLEQIKMCSGKAVIVDSNEDFTLNIGNIRSKISDRTRAIMINSPNNPTGAVYSKKQLKELADLAIENDIMIISDEMYEKMIYEGEHISIASLNDEIKNLTITINGLSKSHCMTGLRVGYAAGPKEFIEPMIRVQSQMTSNINTTAQYGAIEALKDDEYTKKMVRVFADRRKIICEELESIDGVSLVRPKGAFYVYPDVREILKTDGTHSATHPKTSMELTYRLLDDAKIAVIPGSAFGTEGFLRLSYALSEDRIVEGIKRMKEILK